MKIVDKTEKYISENNIAIDKSLTSMAGDIIRLSQQRVPLLTGALKTSIRHVRIDQKKHAVLANKEYAAYQEFGQRKDGSRRVTRYSKSGTGKGYLLNSAQTIQKRKGEYLRRFKVRKV